jgi:hypothetical protein
MRARALASLIPPARTALSEWIEVNVKLPEAVSAWPGAVRFGRRGGADPAATTGQGNRIVERAFPTLQRFHQPAAASSPAACARLDRSGDISQPSNPANRAIVGLCSLR